jgi:hypothetical protein
MIFGTMKRKIEGRMIIMNKIWSEIIIAIVPAVLSYLAAIRKSKQDLKTVKENHKAEIERIERQSEQDIKRLEKELEAQSKLYESNAQTDVISEYMRNPKKFQDMLNLMNDPRVKRFMK